MQRKRPANVKRHADVDANCPVLFVQRRKGASFQCPLNRRTNYFCTSTTTPQLSNLFATHTRDSPMLRLIPFAIPTCHLPPTILVAREQESSKPLKIPHPANPWPTNYKGTIKCSWETSLLIKLNQLGSYHWLSRCGFEFTIVRTTCSDDLKVQ